MTRQWLRSCSVSLEGGPTIVGGGPNDLRITFQVMASSIQTPNAGEIRVYNPSPNTAAQFRGKEGKKVTLLAGYEDNVGLIYTGQIKQTIFRKEDAVTTYLVMYCADGDNAYRQARVGETVPKGHTLQDRVDVALKAMGPFGISPKLGKVNVDLSQPKFPRGIPLVGMARDVLRLVGMSVGATWSMHDGQVHMISPLNPINGDAVRLNSSTGLIGFPEQTEDGVIVRSLINPAFGVNGLVQIDQASIQLGAKDYQSLTSDASQKNINLPLAGFIAADGLYYIAFMETEGDTRGGPWFQTITFLAVHGSAPSVADVHSSPFPGPYIGRAG